MYRSLRIVHPQPKKRNIFCHVALNFDLWPGPTDLNLKISAFQLFSQRSLRTLKLLRGHKRRQTLHSRSLSIAHGPPKSLKWLAMNFVFKIISFLYKDATFECCKNTYSDIDGHRARSWFEILRDANDTKQRCTSKSKTVSQCTYVDVYTKIHTI